MTTKPTRMIQILLPTDFSATAFKAAQFAFDIYGARGVRYTLVNTYMHPAFDNALLPDITGLVRRNSLKGLRAMDRKCRNYAEKVVLAKVSTTQRLPEALNGITAKKGGDLIVMGTQGEGNYGVVGSNTTAVVLGTNAPVITVPMLWTPTPIERILLAHDGRQIDRMTLKPLIALARRTKAKIVVTHIRSNIVTMDARMDRATISRVLGTIPHSFVTVQGDKVVSTLDDLARKGRVQLVAMVHRKRGFWEDLFHASRAKRMAMHTHLPVLVLRQQN